MAKKKYEEQVVLLLAVIPEINKEKCFALHGGTAINLFIRNMLRLSVDIDLTYIPIEEREPSFKNINEALLRTKSRIESIVPGVTVTHRPADLKLMISTNYAIIKLEVNQIKRGVYADTSEVELCQSAQNEFDSFVSCE